jgi:hypothetical protein
MYALLEGSQDIEQYLSSIHRYIQIGIYVKGYFSKALGRFQREIMEVCEFYVDQDNKPRSNELYSKTLDGRVTLHNPTKKLIDYLGIGNVYFDTDDIFGLGDADYKEDLSNLRDGSSDNYANKKTSSEALDKMLNENATDGNEGGEAKPAEQAPAAPAAPAPQTTAPAPAATPATTQTVAQPAAPAPVAPAPAPAPVAASAVTPVAQAPAPPAPQAPVVKPVTTTVAQPTQGTPVAQQTTAVPPAPQVVKPVVAAPQVQVQATAAPAAPQQAGSATPATATDVL